MGIKMAVGVNGVKKGGDVGTIQNLLNTRYSDTPAFKTAADKVIPADERASPTTLLKQDNDCGSKTTKAILAFQQAVVKMPNPDGTVEPNRRTWKLLNGNLERPIAITNRNVNGEYVPMNQGAYKNVKLGDQNNDKISIGSKGCMLTCYTMAATVIGRETEHWQPCGLQPKNLTPALVNRIFLNAGAYSGAEMYPEIAAEALGMKLKKECGRPNPLTAGDMGKFEEHLVKRHPVVAWVDYNGSAAGDHFVLVIGKNVDGTYKVLDPNGGGEFAMSVDPKGNARYNELKKDKKYGKLFGSKQETACTRERNTNKNQQDYIMIWFGLLSPA